MKKSTLLKLVLVVAAALSLYGQAKSSETETTTSRTCPSFCFHLTCGGAHAHCVNGQCVCP